MTNLSLLHHFYPADIAPTSWENDELLYAGFIGHSLWSAISCQRKKKRHALQLPEKRHSRSSGIDWSKLKRYLRTRDSTGWIKQPDVPPSFPVEKGEPRASQSDLETIPIFAKKEWKRKDWKKKKKTEKKNANRRSPRAFSSTRWISLTWWKRESYGGLQ